MSARIMTLDTTVHKAVQELLPWFVTETLEGEQLAMVQEHVRTCAQCQSDIAWQRKFQTVYLPSNALPDVDKAFAQFSARLDAPQQASALHSMPTQSGAAKPDLFAKLKSWFAGENSRWMGWALAAQCAVIVGLGFQLVSSSMTPAAYHVLGSPKDVTGNVVVMFKPEMKEKDLRRILQASDARVVDGPTVTDAYLLNVPDEALAQSVEKLRAEPGVALVEPLNAGGAR
ncbi:zf-HC2 domain-containing protein [Undibacterium sp.]|uniref:zf-HC2 domain-containing protein n=1 Tax=Undibacterium sp. TaxID=1914977 RepID=UPI00374D428A